MKKQLDEKALRVLSCSVAVAVMILLLSGDMIISKFIRVNPNQEVMNEEKDDASNVDDDFKEHIKEPPVQKDILDEPIDPIYDTSFLQKIDLSSLMTKIQNKEVIFLFSGRSTCGHCIDFLPILKDVFKILNVQTGFYIDRNSVLESDEVYDTFLKLSPVIENNFIGTPFFMIFKDGQFQDYIMGMPHDKNDLKNRLEDMIKKYQ